MVAPYRKPKNCGIVEFFFLGRVLEMVRKGVSPSGKALHFDCNISVVQIYQPLPNIAE